MVKLACSTKFYFPVDKISLSLAEGTLKALGCGWLGRLVILTAPLRPSIVRSSALSKSLNIGSLIMFYYVFIILVIGV